eukprot:6566423-Lingulodinium_polyedra.AAC.1
MEATPVGTTSVVEPAVIASGAGAASAVEFPVKDPASQPEPGVGLVPPPSHESLLQYLLGRPQKDI